jgi:HD-GYP domain-containing protein (c-di-GMP phosphodiesterase class II)
VSTEPARLAALPAAVEAGEDGDALIEARRERVGLPLAARESLAGIGSALAFLLAAASISVLLAGDRHPSPFLVGALLVAYALASRIEFEVGTGSAIPTQLVFVPMLFLLPAGLVPLCVAAGLVLGNGPDYARGRAHPERALGLVASSWHAIGPALVLGLAGEPAPSWSSWPLFLLALVAQFVFDFAGSATYAHLAFRVRPWAHAPAMGWVYGVDAALSPTAFLIAQAAYGTKTAFVVVFPLLALLAFLAQERRRRIDHALELGHAYRGTAFLLGDVIEADDEYTGSHSRDVVELALGVADRLGLSPGERRSTELTALLHDVGKIRIPGEIINKPGALTDEERAIINTHTIEGERMLERVGGLLGEVGRLVRSCHERWDGGGYPDGLVGEATPIVARIVCCCDAFNAMTTDRPYRAALTAEVALAEVERNAGTQFDPRVVAALAAVLADELA